MKANKGFTLIEMAVVLAIIAILAAILTPLVIGYIDQARITRAHGDVTSIRDSVLLYKRDTSYWPAYDTLTTAKASTTPDKTCLLSGTNAAASDPTAWTCTTKGLLSTYINLNSLGITSSGNNLGGVPAFRGPYLDGLTGNDPWGNPYWVTSQYLVSSGTNGNDWAFVVSTGADGSMSTTQTQVRTTAFASGGDDIAAVIK